MFRIQSIAVKPSNYLGDHSSWLVDVVVLVPAKEWTKRKSKKQLGMLYGVDISNAVYAINQNIPASCPTVDDRSRASKGFKTIRLSYRLTDAAKAEALGLKVRRYANGSFSHEYGDYVRIPVPVQEPKLALVVG